MQSQQTTFICNSLDISMMKPMIVFLGSLLALTPGLAATHKPQDFLKQVAGTKDEGKRIVQHFCANCHAEAPLIQIGAPRIGNQQDWHVRLKKGLPVLLQNTENGLNAMPPMGGCFECSEEQLRLAILEMIPKDPKRSKKAQQD